jgi:hypothetical protein
MSTPEELIEDFEAARDRMESALLAYETACRDYIETPGKTAKRWMLDRRAELKDAKSQYSAALAECEDAIQMRSWRDEEAYDLWPLS